ncbi:MAG: SNF2-related protein [Phycisphaeraceae bacterium]
MSILTSWSPFFQSSARMRGRGYLNEERVERLEPGPDELVRARVQGGETYLVTIAEEDGRAEAECTCPQFQKGTYCKHIWATLLDVQQNPDGPGANAETLAGLRVRAPKARKRTGSAQPARPAEPEWIGRLTLLRPPADEMEPQSATDLLPAQRQVVFAVLPQRSARRGGLVVELRQRTPIATGWSKSKPLKLSGDTLATLADAGDRELVALLIGSQQHDDQPGGLAGGTRPHAMYRLPSGAWRTLLKRMIDTGRCVLEADEEISSETEQPLIWAGDEPWVLHLVGDLIEDELLVHLELRREGERLPIEKPELLLGGPGGLVIYDGKAAPLDDRESFRWAVQFRDEAERHGKPQPMHVPRADVDRFLDRLYMLPQLPELDLPEGIGRVPRQVDPVPHLDLFSPESAEARDALPASARNQLLGRVWFEYEGQRVSPLQPGRFVTISSSASQREVAPAPAAEGNGHAPAEAAQEAEQASAAAESDGEAASAEQAGTPDLVQPAEPVEAFAEQSEDGLLIRRDRRAEREAVRQLVESGLRPLSSAGPDGLALPLRQMGPAVATLLAQGWKISADQRGIRIPGAASLSVASGIDWFELRGNVRYHTGGGEEQEVSLPEILAAAREGRQMVTLADGSQGLLPEQWLSEHGLLTSLGELEGDHLRFHASQAALLDAMLDERELVSVDERFEQIRQRLREFSGVEPEDPEAIFQGTLRPYQREGLGWMAFLRWFGFGGILADDMGLGKTIQVLAMIQTRRREMKEAGEEHRPTLVVAPRSVIFNWIDEAQRFTPELRVQAYAGPEREPLREAFAEHDLIVTSYGLLRRDIAELREQSFDYVILDEAQAIKNPTSQAAKAARIMPARYRLALTGTPVENHLGDLWSIFEFLNPGMLGSNRRFAELVRASGNGSSAPDANPTERELVGQVGRVLRPFILRRTKKQVLSDLPEKTEQTIVCEMEPRQRKVYEELRSYYRGHLLDRLDGQKSLVGGTAGFMVLEALLRLRQAACHPGLIDDRRAGEGSAKLDVLLELLADIIEENSKALIFSQFTTMLGLVRKKLDERGIKYAYLDGQTRNRREVVEQFQNDPDIPVFLISLKTGGFGLNLTAAEYVFILDPWWNPAVEQQAIDRTHRIGQTQRVFAYRLICEDTVEQRILSLQQRKREIADAVVGGEQNVLRALTREDLEQLLS